MSTMFAPPTFDRAIDAFDFGVEEARRRRQIELAGVDVELLAPDDDRRRAYVVSQAFK